MNSTNALPVLLANAKHQSRGAERRGASPRKRKGAHLMQLHFDGSNHVPFYPRGASSLTAVLERGAARLEMTHLAMLPLPVLMAVLDSNGMIVSRNQACD